MDVQVSFARLAAFRCQVHASFTLRGDVLLEMLESILMVPGLTAAVHVCLAPAFRRTFCAVYEALRAGRLNRDAMRQALAAAVPEDACTIAGYEVHAIDTTPHPRPDAKTMPHRTPAYLAAQERWVPGFVYSWLGRVIAPGLSWIAPLEIDHVPTDRTAGEVGAQQVRQLATQATAKNPKVVVADSNYTAPTFLSIFAGLSNVFGLIRVASNRVLFGLPPEGSHGNRKHGAKFSMHAPTAPPSLVTVEILGHSVRISAWPDLHFEKVAQVSGLLLRVEFLNPDGTPRYKRPWWLFWTGPKHVPLDAVVRMYLLRYTIEHFFRFLKQRLGLLAAHTPEPEGQHRWIWLVALAYWQLLLGRHLVVPRYHPWDPASRRNPSRPLTPGQVLDAWAGFSRGLADLDTAPRPAGKAPGRQPGFHPEPRQKHPVTIKKKVKAPAKA